jgi:hypothetical protein
VTGTRPCIGKLPVHSVCGMLHVTHVRVCCVLRVTALAVWRCQISCEYMHLRCAGLQACVYWAARDLLLWSEVSGTVEHSITWLSRLVYQNWLEQSGRREANILRNKVK